MPVKEDKRRSIRDQVRKLSAHEEGGQGVISSDDSTKHSLLDFATLRDS